MKKFLAGFLTVIILVLFPIVLLGTLTRYQLFTAPTIQYIIRSSQIAEQLPNIILAFITKEESTTPIDVVATTEFVSKALTPKTVYGFTDTAVDTLDAWWNSDKSINQLELTLDLGSIKQQLPSPPDENIGQFVQAIPDTINLQDVLQDQVFATTGAAQMDQLNQQIGQFRLYWQWLHWVIWIGWGVIALCLLLIVLLRLYPGYAPFSWLGWLHVLMTIELAPLVVLVWLAPTFILPWLAGTLDSALVIVINHVVSAIFAQYLWPLTWVMVATLGNSIVWFIVRAIVKHHNKA